MDKILEKYIKNHPIVVGAYTKGIVSNSVRKEVMDTKIMANNIKDKVDDISSSSASYYKSINELNISDNSAKKAINTATRHLSSLAKK